MKRPKRIKLLYLRSVFNGEDIYFNRFIERLDLACFHPIICYLRGPIPENTVLAQKGFEVLGFSCGRKDLRYFNPQIVFALKKIIKEKAIDLIHAYRHKSTVYAALAAFKDKNVKIISHVLSTRRNRSISRRLQNLFLMQRVDSIVGVSDAVGEDIIRNNYCIDPEKVRTIYSSIDLERFKDLPDRKYARYALGLPEERWIWGIVGRLAHVKGHDILLEAFSRGCFKKHSCHLAFAGDGMRKSELMEVADRFGIAGHVDFLGHVTDIPVFLAAIDGFSFPSRDEGLGRALIEALAAGLPCVASRVGGITEVLRELDKNGLAFLVPPGDPSALKSAMENVMAWDDAMRARASVKGKKKAFSFGIESFAADMQGHYREVVC